MYGADLDKATTDNEKKIKVDPPLADVTPENFNRIFASAMDRAAEGHQKVGIMLSGGIDSANMLAHLVKNKNIKEIIAYTWGGWGMESTDVRYSKLSIEKFGIARHRIVCKSEDYAGELSDFRKELVAHGKPLNYFESIPYISLRKLMLEDGVTLIYHGQNADTLWMGYPAPVRVYFASLFLNPLGLGKILNPFRLIGYYKSNSLYPYVKTPKGYWDRIWEKYAKIAQLHTRLQNKIIMMEQAYTESPIRQAHQHGIFEQAGIKVCTPYYDDEVVHFALSVSNKERKRNGWNKAMLHDVARLNGVPDEVIEKGKKGLSYGYTSYIKQKLHLLIWDEMAKNEELNRYVDIPKARRKKENDFYAFDRLRSLHEFLKTKSIGQ